MVQVLPGPSTKHSHSTLPAAKQTSFWFSTIHKPGLRESAKVRQILAWQAFARSGMTSYRVIRDDQRGFAVEVTDPEGAMYVASGFQAESSARTWITERLDSNAARRAERTIERE
jgi:hypothetical protein